MQQSVHFREQQSAEFGRPDPTVRRERRARPLQEIGQRQAVCPKKVTLRLLCEYAGHLSQARPGALPVRNVSHPGNGHPPDRRVRPDQ